MRFWPDRSNLLAILNQVAKFRPNRSTRGGVMTSYTISRWRPRRSILLPVSYLMSLSSKGQFLSANQTSSTYLNPRLRYNYFRFGKTTVRHIEILLPVSILTTSPYSACHSTLGWRILSKSVNPLQIISIFKMAATAAQFYFRLQIGLRRFFRMSVSISKPYFVVITPSASEI